MGLGLYTLDGHTPVHCPNAIEWAKWLQGLAEDDRRVAYTEVSPGVAVSTVFLAVDHGWRSARPVLFETAILNDYGIEIHDRYCSWEEAEAGHWNCIDALNQLERHT